MKEATKPEQADEPTPKEGADIVVSQLVVDAGQVCDFAFDRGMQCGYMIAILVFSLTYLAWNIWRAE